MKKVLIFLFFLCFLSGVKAEINLEVRDFRCEPNLVMSGEYFHVYATVVNLSEEPVDTKIFLFCRTAPDGFWGFDEVHLLTYEISLPGLGETEIDEYTYFVGEDERFELYFLNIYGELISDYCPLQLGECGSEVERVKLDTTDMHLRLGMTSSLLTWVYPGSAPQQVTWEVEHPEVIKILEYYERGDQGIVFEATAVGETDITVTAVNGLSATAHIRVTDPIRAESITLNTYEITGEIGDTFQLEAHTLPENNDATVLYISKDDKVATVGLEDGLVTITGLGETEIYAWATVAVDLVQATCIVTGVTSGVDDIDTDTQPTTANIYSLDGTLIDRDATPERINQLPRGCYILRYPTKTVKIFR